MNSQDYTDPHHKQHPAQYFTSFTGHDSFGQPPPIDQVSHPNYPPIPNVFPSNIPLESQQLGNYSIRPISDMNYSNVSGNHLSYAYPVSGTSSVSSSSDNFNQAHENAFRSTAPLKQEMPKQNTIESRLTNANIPYVNVTNPNAISPVQNDPSTRYRSASLSAVDDSNKPYKRPRRRSDQIDRYYSCNFKGCTKSYGTLNHLNAHVLLQKHGPRRRPNEFKEVKKIAKAKRKEQQMLKTIKEFSQKNNLMFISLNQNQAIANAAAAHAHSNSNTSSPTEISASSPETLGSSTPQIAQHIKMEYSQPAGLGLNIHEQFNEQHMNQSQPQAQYPTHPAQQGQPMQHYQNYHHPGPSSRMDFPVPNYKNM